MTEPWKTKANWDKFNPEILDVKAMSPTKFYVISNRHFVFSIDHIDNFLIKTITIEPRKIPLIGNSGGIIVATFYNSISPSFCSQLNEWEKENFWKKIQGRNAKLELLDPVGAIIGKIHYKNMKIKSICRGTYDYSNNGLSEIKVILSYSKEVFEY